MPMVLPVDSVWVNPKELLHAPEDIEPLFPRVPTNTPVRIINEPYKLGWIDGRLYLEAHQPLSEERLNQGVDFARLNQAIAQVLAEHEADIDWKRVRNAAFAPLGYPVPISLGP